MIRRSRGSCKALIMSLDGGFFRLHELSNQAYVLEFVLRSPSRLIVFEASVT